MKFFIMVALPVFYIVGGILSLNGIYIVRNAEKDAYFLLGLGGLSLVYIMYILYKKRTKKNPSSFKSNSKHSYFEIGMFLFIIIPSFILRELGIYFTDDISIIIVLLIILFMTSYQMKRIKKKEE